MPTRHLDDGGKSALGVEAVAGILPHDEGIDQAASQGLIHEASDNLPL